VRYAENSIAISEGADVPVLRTVYNAGHLTFDQLYAATFPYVESKNRRDGLSWRVRRLVEHGFLDARVVDGLGLVLSLGESGELYLQSQPGMIVERRTRAKGSNLRSQMWHDVELFGIRLELQRAGVALTWQSEAEVRAQNRVASLRFAKEYDAVVTFHSDDLSAEIALEFERTMKSADAYARIFAQLETETLLTRFLFLAPDGQAQLLLRDAAPAKCPRIYVAITNEFRAQPETAALLDLFTGATVRLSDCLA
jgi:hypothetical protein